MNAYLLCAVGNPSFGLQIAGSGVPISGPACFGPSVACCKREFQRLRQVAFASGGHLVSARTGDLCGAVTMQPNLKRSGRRVRQRQPSRKFSPEKRWGHA